MLGIICCKLLNPFVGFLGKQAPPMRPRQKADMTPRERFEAKKARRKAEFDADYDGGGKEAGKTAFDEAKEQLSEQVFFFRVDRL
jgi:hypothetical protein